MTSSGRDRSSEANPEAQNKTTPPQDNASRPWTETENPFIAFRRYADEQVSSVLQSMMGLPSMAAQPFTDKDNSIRSLRKTNEEVDRDADSSPENHWNRHRRCSHRDGDFSDHWTRSRIHSFLDGFPIDFGPSLLFPESMSLGGEHTWPLTYLMFSSYSPLYLEQSQKREGRFLPLFSSRKPAEQDPNEPQWREAFEDLLRVTNGQEMLDQSTASERRNQPAKRWLQGLVQRGSLGNDWKLLGPADSPHGVAFEKSERYNYDSRDQDPQFLQGSHEEESKSNSAESELDLYDRFLDDIANAHERYSHAFADSPLMRLLDEERKRHTQASPQDSIDESSRSKDWLEYTFNGNKDLLASQSTLDDNSSGESRVVSTMTRSVRRTLPDGSISTKTVKTKHFSDGSEESDESVEVTPPPLAERNATFENGKEVQDSRGGWFWTR